MEINDSKMGGVGVKNQRKFTNVVKIWKSRRRKIGKLQVNGVIDFRAVFLKLDQLEDSLLDLAI